MKLPETFINRMQKCLPDSMPDFLASFSAPAVKAFHLNHSRTQTAAFDAWLAEKTTSIGANRLPDSGIYITETDGIGHHPLHHAGLIYSQDPSAQLVADSLPISKDQRILDLCAAPGGKTSQLARIVDGGSGFVMANEPHPARFQILLGNMERMGYRNVCVTNLPPEEIAGLYPEFFDVVVVDAPCSGEGMFRKYPESIKEWSPENVLHCSHRQKEILQSAVACLRPGGLLIYSTCTYAPEEDEEQVRFLQEEYGFSITDAPAPVQRYAQKTSDGCYRAYPHLFQGEGQFMAYLTKGGIDTASGTFRKNHLPITLLSSAEKQAFEEIFGLSADALPLFSWRGRTILLPFSLPRLPSYGIGCLGVTAMEWDAKRKRYVPHHHFFSACGNLLPLQINLSAEDPLLRQYLNGAELPAPEGFPKGHAAICCMGAGVGGVRIAGGRMKNLYPKGLRDHL